MSDKCIVCVNREECNDKENSINCLIYKYDTLIDSVEYPDPTKDIITDDASYLQDIENRPDVDNEEMSIGELTELYAGLRNDLSDHRKEFKAIEKSIKLSLEEIEVKILEAQRKIGVKSISTGNYTAFQTKKVSVRMGNWDEFSKYILKSGNIHLIEKRPAKLASLELEESGVDLSTIGLDKSTEICIQVRKR